MLNEHIEWKQMTHLVKPHVLRTQKQNFVDPEVANPKKGQERRWQKCQEQSTRRNVNKDIDSSKVGENHMPF